MYLTETLQKKWQPVLEHEDLPKIDSSYKKAVTVQLLENQEKSLMEAAPANATGNVGNWDPILISLVRRAMPQLVAYDVCGVQPMTGPTGLIFAMKSLYGTGTEALFNEAETDNDPGAGATPAHAGTEPVAGLDASPVSYTTGIGMTTAAAEAKGDATPNNFSEMKFSIDKVTVTAKSRALKAEYSIELAQDLKAVHGLDAETELANILSAEILAEINREVVRSIYANAKRGASKTAGNEFTNVATAGTFDLDTDSNGRWAVEKFKGLMFHIERECNIIAKTTRRGKGNLIICSSDVASAMAMAGTLDYSSGLSGGMNVDETANTYAGMLNGKIKVYVDPYATGQHVCVGYRGTSPYDAGMFYCPYVPLQMVRAVGEQTFQPKIGFKTRYGLVPNPFINTSGAIVAKENWYYRLFAVSNLM